MWDGKYNARLKNVEIQFYSGNYHLTIETFTLTDAQTYKLFAENIHIIPSFDALIGEGIIAFESLIMDRITVSPSVSVNGKSKEGASQVEQASPVTALTSIALSQIKYIETIRIPEINLQASSQSLPLSYIFFDRYETFFSIDGELRYFTSTGEAAILMEGGVKRGEAEEISIQFQNITPDELAAIVPFFDTLSGIEIPLNIDVQMNIVASGRPESARIQIQPTSGRIFSNKNIFTVENLVLDIEADFRTQNATIRKGEITVNETKIELQGDFHYDMNSKGNVTAIQGKLIGSDTQLSLSNIFNDDIYVQNFALDIDYDLDGQHIRFLPSKITAQNIDIELSGALVFAGDDGHANVQLLLGEGEMGAALSLWPNIAAPKARKWVTSRLSGGKIPQAKIAVAGKFSDFQNVKQTRYLPRHAVDLDIIFADSQLQFFDEMTALENAYGRVLVDGYRTHVDLASGRLYDDIENDYITITKGLFEGKHYREPGEKVNLIFQAKGGLEDILHILNQKPLTLMDRIKLDADLFSGDTHAEVKLGFPLKPQTKLQDVDIDIGGEVKEFAMTPYLIEYPLEAGQLAFKVSNSDLSVSGSVKIDQVDFLIDALFPFQEQAQKIKLTAPLAPTDVARLGFEMIVPFYTGIIDMELQMHGRGRVFSEYHIDMDLSAAEIHELPVAYIKPAGQEGQVSLSLKTNPERTYRNFSVDFKSGEDQIVAQGKLVEGKLQELQASPIRFGGDNEFTLAINMDEAGAQHLSIGGDRLSVSDIKNLWRYASSFEEAESTEDIFADNMKLAISLNNLIGENNISLTNVSANMQQQNSKIEALNFIGYFTDGMPLAANLSRATNNERHLHVTADHGGEIFVGLGLTQEISDGKLKITAQFFDNPILEDKKRISAKGHFRMQEFQLGEVPVFAQILSVASFTGLLDTLQGDGILFERGEFDFRLIDQKWEIMDGIFSGPSLGVTVYGAVDFGTDQISTGGVLVPSYTLNSLLGGIPILGTVLTGGKQEGILGVSYRVSGDIGDPSVIVNPASLMTPGILRRIFNIGIGNTEKD